MVSVSEEVPGWAAAAADWSGWHGPGSTVAVLQQSFGLLSAFSIFIYAVWTHTIDLQLAIGLIIHSSYIVEWKWYISLWSWMLKFNFNALFVNKLRASNKALINDGNNSMYIKIRPVIEPRMSDLYDWQLRFRLEYKGSPNTNTCEAEQVISCR